MGAGLPGWRRRSPHDEQRISCSGCGWRAATDRQGMRRRLDAGWRRGAGSVGGSVAAADAFAFRGIRFLSGSVGEALFPPAVMGSRVRRTVTASRDDRTCCRLGVELMWETRSRGFLAKECWSTDRTIAGHVDHRGRWIEFAGTALGGTGSRSAARFVTRFGAIIALLPGLTTWRSIGASASQGYATGGEQRAGVCCAGLARSQAATQEDRLAISRVPRS